MRYLYPLIAILTLIGLVFIAPIANASTNPYISQMKTDGVHTQLKGSQEKIWAESSLKALGAPLTKANLATMYDWFLNEGTPHNYNNPLNLNTSYGGSWSSTEDGDPLADHIQHYPSPKDFPPAFNLQLRKHGPDWPGGKGPGEYYYIITALKSGKGMIGNHSAGLKYDLSEYSGGGYNSIPAAYCPCS